jgi:hypothetical protein
VKGNGLDWLTRIYLLWMAVISGVTGLRRALDPMNGLGDPFHPRAATATVLSGAQAMAHMRVTGSASLAVAIALLYCLVSVERLRSGLKLALCSTAMSLVLRALGLVVAGGGDIHDRHSLQLEALFVVVAIVLITLRDRRAIGLRRS